MMIKQVGVVLVVALGVASACSSEFSSDCFEIRTCPRGPSDAGAAGEESAGAGGIAASGGSDSGLGGAPAAAAAGDSNGGATAAGAGAGGETSDNAATCGDGQLTGAEALPGGCDDANDEAGDGCSDQCTVESGWDCDGNEPTQCSSICGDGLVVGPEAVAGGCDDGETEPGDGCSDECEVEDRFQCKGEPSTCECKAGYVADGSTCERTSCVGLSKSCGSFANDDCCAAPTVPGGQFVRDEMSELSTISSFALDKYEVTVGRFRRFLSEYSGPPANGAGAHPLIASSGWQSPAWDSSIASNSAGITAAVQCHTTYQTWSIATANDFLPMNCVSWYEAFAFCAWDGGRLPTDAEHEYAATGGSSRRYFPWGDEPVPSDLQDATAAYANYNCLGDGSAPGVCAFTDILRVGSKPAGIGKYGQLDLSGSVWEWSLDDYDEDAVRPDPCNDCAVFGTGASNRVFHGGSFAYESLGLYAGALAATAASKHDGGTGFRCARAP